MRLGRLKKMPITHCDALLLLFLFQQVLLLCCRQFGLLSASNCILFLVGILFVLTGYQWSVPPSTLRSYFFRSIPSVSPVGGSVISEVLASALILLIQNTDLCYSCILEVGSIVEDAAWSCLRRRLMAAALESGTVQELISAGKHALLWEFVLFLFCFLKAEFSVPELVPVISGKVHSLLWRTEKNISERWETGLHDQTVS